MALLAVCLAARHIKAQKAAADLGAPAAPAHDDGGAGAESGREQPAVAREAQQALEDEPIIDRRSDGGGGVDHHDRANNWARAGSRAPLVRLEAAGSSAASGNHERSNNNSYDNLSGAKSWLLSEIKLNELAESKLRRDAAERERPGDRAAPGTERHSPKPPKSASKRLDRLLLKRILQQTLPRAQSSGDEAQPNATSGAAPISASSNFRFVFIQRATAAPVARVSKNLETPDSPAGLASSTTSERIQAEQAPRGALETAKTKRPRGGLSKQAASTKQLQQPDKVSGLDQLAVAASSLVDNEIKRTSKPASDQASARSKQVADSVAATLPNVKAAAKKRPSKVYKLPLKFVSNGQANSVMLHTLKQHFSMIKRINQATKSSVLNAVVESGSRLNQTRKQGSKLRGNSRLIYLPLKYLSNAKPNMFQVIATRASHKSASDLRHR